MRSLVGRFLRRLASQDGGNVLIEFALAAPILCFMLLGGLDLGRYAMQKSAIGEGARAGAQYGVFNPTDSTNINTTAQNAAGLSGVTAINSFSCECGTAPTTTTVSCTTTSCNGGGTPKQYITVTTSKPYSSVLTSSTLNFGVFSWTPPTSMSASVTMIVPQ
jgi:Flp pilus assembly protein TadG